MFDGILSDVISDASISQPCQKSTCSKATIETFVSNVTTGCASDLSAAGITYLPAMKQYAKQDYDTARQILCLKECVSTLHSLLTSC